ncbi:hypothetical protein OOT46_00205 [Aquabacterium sp. A7-Y]|uniref:hypothetical protein n=1 Tax=Aquabacterium sp. A7-Y TaxID=1349605 RepID=UPI00223E68B0|nr:hypothetical protein [Aquabacterium sp. A7-Y]MCW7536275.1 hypothetical protein [Aquabacterium sp. A7-Y]
MTVEPAAPEPAANPAAGAPPPEQRTPNKGSGINWSWIGHLGLVSAFLGFVGLVVGRVYTWSYLETAGVPTQFFSYSTQDLIFFGYLSLAADFQSAILLLAGVLLGWGLLIAFFTALAPWARFVLVKQWIPAMQQWRLWNFLARCLGRAALIGTPLRRLAAWAHRNRAGVAELSGPRRRRVPDWLWILTGAGVVGALFLPASICWLLVRVAFHEGRSQFKDELAAYQRGDSAVLKKRNLRHVIVEREQAEGVRTVAGLMVQATAETVALHNGRALEIVKVDNKLRCLRSYPAWDRPNLDATVNCGAEAKPGASKTKPEPHAASEAVRNVDTREKTD